MEAPDLSPILQGQQAARQQWGDRSAQNTFAKTNFQTQGNRQLADFRQGFQRQLPQFSASFARRGIGGGGMKSGIQQRAMKNYMGDYTRDLGRMQEDIFNGTQSFDFNQARFTADRDATLANLAAQKAAIIAGTAQHINGLKPLMGG